MQKPIVLLGRTLVQSDPKPLGSSLTFTLTPAPVDTPALRTSGKGGVPVLIDQIALSCSCTGDYVPGTSTFSGNGAAAIVASTPRVECESKQMLTEGDQVTITCNGTITTTASGTTAPGTAQITVSIADGIQHNVDANKV